MFKLYLRIINPRTRLVCRIDKVYISLAAHTHSNQTYFSGCSIVGKFYGADCCPDVNCLKCHMENGTCVECDPGFQGDRCEQGMSDVNVMISIFEKVIIHLLPSITPFGFFNIMSILCVDKF